MGVMRQTAVVSSSNDFCTGIHPNPLTLVLHHA